jgi:quercetin dioxygenase-like cupin family protein
MDIRRFGPGRRQPEGPPGTYGVSGGVIHQDARGSIVELAFGPRSSMARHANPNTTYLVVIGGGGVVQVGSERVRVNHGEAVVWPAGEPHAAWTEGTEMRAILVELVGADDSWVHDRLNLLSPAPLSLAREAKRDRLECDQPAGTAAASAGTASAGTASAGTALPRTVPGGGGADRGGLAPDTLAAPYPAQRDLSSGEPW